MKLLLIGNYLNRSRGYQNAWHDLALHLQSAGYGIRTTSTQGNKFLRLLDMLKTIWFYRSDYQIAEIDVFSGSAFTWAECCVYLLRALKIPYILNLRGGNLSNFATMHNGRVKSILESAVAVVSPSHFLQHKMKQFRRDIQVISNAIDIKKYPFQLRQAPDPKLIWLRSFHEIYNPALAPKVVYELSVDFPEIKLIMVGPDEKDGSKQKMERLAIELGVADRIEVPGGAAKTEVPIWLNKGDIFINTTNYDNTPLSVIEAMACGLCIVSTNVGGIPYLLEDEKDALLVPPNNAYLMANAIHRILNDPQLSERLSNNARIKAEQFDWYVILPKWEALFQSLSQQ